MPATSPAPFVKRYDPRQLEVETRKAQLMADAGALSGVRVPRVLDVDEATASIRYEHLDCPLSLLDLMSDRRASRQLILSRVHEAGAALARLHRVLPLDGFPCHRRSELFERSLGPRPAPPGDDRLVLQHGDFGYSNVRFGPSGELVVIDPSPNLYVSVDPLNVDHPELDLALIGSNFLGRTVRPLAMARTVAWGPSLFGALLNGYEQEGGPIDRARLRAYTVATVEAFATWCQRGRPQILVPLARLLERNLP